MQIHTVRAKMSQMTVETMANLLSAYAAADTPTNAPSTNDVAIATKPTSGTQSTPQISHTSCSTWLVLVGGVCVLGGVLALAIHYGTSRTASRRMLHAQQQYPRHGERYETRHKQQYEDEYTQTTYGTL